MFANAESMLLAFKKKREPKFGTKNKEVYYNLLKVSTLLELKYPEPHLKILKSIKGDDNENHSNLLNIPSNLAFSSGCILSSLFFSLASE